MRKSDEGPLCIVLIDAIYGLAERQSPLSLKNHDRCHGSFQLNCVKMAIAHRQCPLVRFQ